MRPRQIFLLALGVSILSHPAWGLVKMWAHKERAMGDAANPISSVVADAVAVLG